MENNEYKEPRESTLMESFNPLSSSYYRHIDEVNQHNHEVWLRKMAEANREGKLPPTPPCVYVVIRGV